MLFTEPFLSTYGSLSARARALKERLPDVDYRHHPDVKLFLAVRSLATDTIPRDPADPAYRLHGDLAGFRRTKGRGLPPRYRLFWIFNEEARVIILLYLNDSTSLRQAGGRRDPYAIFSAMVKRGEMGPDFQANYERWRRGQPPPPRGAGSA